MTFFSLPYQDLGFTDTEWEDATPNEKRIIRDWVLNGHNQTRTVIYDFYEDDSSIRKVFTKYRLEERPHIQINFTSFNLY